MTVVARKDNFWLPWRIILVGQENQIRATQKIQIEQLRTCMTYALSFSLFCPCFRQNANTTLSLQLPMKFGNIVLVETSRYLTKITTLQRKADRKQLLVLAAKHTASLQLLCTAGGNHARVDARTECNILEHSPKGGGGGS